jgi:regulator of protease activity HflC (stomatin/prohibitin superfamily)
MGRRDEEESYHQSSRSTNGKLITIAIVLALIGILAVLSFRFETVKGNELAIKETFSGGVQTNILQPKTYLLWRMVEDIIPYDVSSQVYDLEDYKVQSLEGQDLTIRLSLRWRLDPARLREVHMTLREHLDKKVIEPTVQRVVKDEATRLKATDAYSGEGLVKLQSTIQTDLASPTNELRLRGIIVETFVIKHIDLDTKYIDEIKKKQIAAQRQLRAVEEQKAAEAEALVAKSTAQADLNKAVVEAQRDKETAVLKAEAAQETAILAAKGEQQKFTLEAEGKMQAAISEAKGIEALGRAKAEAQRLQLQAYNVPGADAYVTVEVAKSVASGMQNIQGYLPANMSVNVISEDVMKSVQGLVGKKVAKQQ